MPIYASVIALLLAISSLACSTQPPDDASAAADADAIFRYVVIGPNVHVRLGEPMPSLARPFLEQVGPRDFSVRAGWGEVPMIRFHLGADGRVASASFGYDPAEESFQTKVDSYLETLGPPQIRKQGGGHVAWWEDARTRFEVMEHKGRLKSLLVDRDSAREPAAGADTSRSTQGPAVRDSPRETGRP